MPRRKDPDKRQPVTIRLPQDLLEWLEPFKRGKGRMIERALREMIEREHYDNQSHVPQ